jgi:xanthine dehydrogenase YagT iron-sulfur-binding subunit
MRQPDVPPEGGLSRRGFLKGAGLGVAATTLVGAVKEELRQDAAKTAATPMLAADAVHEVSLLETLRDQLDLTGTKLVCDHGSCGACTVHLDGRPVNSCLLLAVDCAGRKVDTIEGLAKDGKLHPVQDAFMQEDALQCGFCTPGMIMSCKALLDHNPKPNRGEVQEALAGNVCRCGTYFNIFRAVDRASGTLSGGK